MTNIEILDDERWQRIEQVFYETQDLDPEDRRRILEALRAEDPELADEVESLLDADRASDVAFMESPLRLPEPNEDAVDRAFREAPLPLGTEVGAYRLVDHLGRGGTGHVYSAERSDDAFAKKVAVKLIRPASFGRDTARRFRAERQILASLEHPNIARLIDGGTLETGHGIPGGLPYLIMERVDGEPIDAYCRNRRLGLSERLELFVKVCAAASYAHDRLVVHRDLKPSNILVTGAGEPKLLDFGIAKLLEPEPGAESVGPVELSETSAWMRVLTPNYAAPEQILGRPITAATDVYALGVLLFLLLTDRLPRKLSGLTLDQVVEHTRGLEPPRPSHLFKGTDEETRARAASLGTTPQQLRRSLDQDLDAVTLHALASDPEERYPSVGRLVDDLERFRSGRPVTVRTPSWFYLASRFVRRHRALSSLVTLLLASLAVYSISLQSYSSRLEAERDVARAERDRNARLVTFMEELFTTADPLADGSVDTTARDVLNRGVEELGSFDDEPDVQARLALRLGKIFLELDDYGAAEPLLARSVRLLREGVSPAEDPGELITALNELGLLYVRQSRYSDADRLHREALSRLRFQEEPDPIALADTLSHMGMANRYLGEMEVSERHHREAVDLWRRHLATHPLKAAVGLNDLAALLIAKGDRQEYAEAEALYREVLDIRRRHLPPDHVQIGNALSNVAYALFNQGRGPEAVPFIDQSVEILARRLGPNHRDTLRNQGNAAILLQTAGQYDDALVRWTDIVGRSEQHLGPADDQTLWSMGRLAETLHSLQRHAQAEQVILDVLAEERKSSDRRAGAQHGQNLNLLGSILEHQKKWDAAQAALGEALDVLRSFHGPEHRFVYEAQLKLGRVELRLGNLDLGRKLIESGAADLVDALGEAHQRSRLARLTLADLRRTQGRPDEALELIDPILAHYRETLDADHPNRKRAEGLRRSIEQALSQTDLP